MTHERYYFAEDNSAQPIRNSAAQGVYDEQSLISSRLAGRARISPSCLGIAAGLF